LENLQAIMRNNPLFHKLPDESLLELSKSAINREIPGSRIVVHQAEIWPFLLLVADGEIEVIKLSPEGRTFIVTTISQGEIFWGLAFFFEDTPNPVFLQTKRKTRFYVWSRNALLPVVSTNPSMAWNLCLIMATRMQLVSGIVEDLAFQPVLSRLSRLILDNFSGADEEFMARELTLEDMAARIGSTREIVCRYLYRFAEKGAIEITRTELRITNRSFLEELSCKK
jgi:CRP/FNR family transcriptional regulator